MHDGIAYFAGRFMGEALELCDGSFVGGTEGGLFTEDHFLLAWDLSSGAILWSRNLSIAHPECQDVSSIAVDEQGRLWYYMRDFGDAQVVRVDANGNDQELRTIAGIRHIGNISFDPWGGLYASGSCDNGTFTFGGQDHAVNSEEGYNMYVLRFKPDGTAGFAEFAQDITFQDPTVVATQDGHAYLAGSMFIETTWGDLTVNEPNWGMGVFITRMDSSGTFQWILGSQEEAGIIEGDIGRAVGPCITVDDAGQVYFLGVSRGTVHWGNGVASGTPTLTERCLTMLAVHPSGVPQWALTSEPATWGITPQAITARAGGGSVHFAVHAADPFGMSGMQVGAEGVQAAVVGRVTPLGTGVIGSKERMPSRIWPNPARECLYIEHTGPSPVQAEVLSVSGQRIRQFTLLPGRSVIGLSGLAQGFYLIRNSSGQVDRFAVE